MVSLRKTGNCAPRRATNYTPIQHTRYSKRNSCSRNTFIQLDDDDDDDADDDDDNDDDDDDDDGSGADCGNCRYSVSGVGEVGDAGCMCKC
uniref:Uncharacterized protein n=1 Tax=Octopus bimaculoides TaxID=37653 RepID=A0A0L8FLI7_OCTBM